jgi:nicotinate-nucleotide pyrophosphorylase (carboxylating)
MISPPPASAVTEVLERAIAEDLGDTGDITSDAIFPPEHRSSARLVAREPGTVAGLEVGLGVFARLGGDVRATTCVADGDRVVTGTVLVEIEGTTRQILAGERICLNLVGHLSGVATATRSMVDAVSDTTTRVVDTRKTTPGLRVLEKYAVRCGGGDNHRLGLHDQAMVKDNHIAAAGSVLEAARIVRRTVGPEVRITVEVDRVDQIDDAIAGGADVVLLDNMRGDVLREAVAKVAGRARTEASGGLSLDTVADVASTGVDMISIGWITHSPPRLDVALDMDASRRSSSFRNQRPREGPSGGAG